MKELKCISCGEFWYVDEADEKEVRYCPYCAKGIWENDGIAVDSFDNALLKVIRLAGTEILKNKNRMIAHLSDLAPNYRKEIRIFSKSCNDTLLNMFYRSSKEDPMQQQQTIGKAKQILLDREGLSQAWVDTVINALVYALGWETGTDIVYRESAVFPAVVATGNNEYVMHAVPVEWEHSGGTVVAAGNNEYGQCNVQDWKDIVSISCSGVHTAGLKNDGRVVATGTNEEEECNVEGWEDIVSIFCGMGNTIALKKDGTMDFVGFLKNAIWLWDWRDIISFAYSYRHAVGLRKNGTVIVAGDNDYGQSNVGHWEKIVSISCELYYTAGVKEDGTVIVAGRDLFHNELAHWQDMISISCGQNYIVGLRKNGTVAAAGDNTCGQCDVGKWRDIIAISCGCCHTIGLKKDGTVVATGQNTYGQCDVGKWRNIVCVAGGANCTIGLKAR